VFAIHLELFGSSVAASRTGATGLDAGVVGLDTLEEEVEGDEGLLLSADCALLGTAVPSVVEVRTRLGDIYRFILMAVAISVLYLDATSLPRKALCFSDGTSGGLDVSSKGAAFFTLFLRASMTKRKFQNKPHQCDRMKVALCSADLPKISRAPSGFLEPPPPPLPSSPGSWDLLDRASSRRLLPFQHYGLMES